MVFQKKGGPAAKRSFSQVKEKVPKKVFEAEEEDDDDDDEEMDDDSDFESDSDDTDSGDARGKLNAKGKQTPIQGKGPSFVKPSPKGLVQSPGFPVKKNQHPGPPQKQSPMMQRQMEFLRKQNQGKGKIIEKQAVEAESDDEDDDDDDDDDDDLEDEDDTDSGDASGKVNAKGKQTPNQVKSTSLMKTPKGQAQQTPAPSSGKKNQLVTPTPKQGKQTPMKEFPGMKGSSQKQTLIKKKEQEDEEDDDEDEDDDDEDDTDSSDAAGKVNAKGKQTPNQVKSTSLMKTPKGQAQQTPAPSSGKKNQLVTPTPKQGKQTPTKESPGMKLSSQRQTIIKKDDEDDDSDEDDEDSDDDDESEEEDVKSKTPAALNKSAVKKEANGKKDMHVSFELPQKGGSALKAKSQQNTPAQAKKNQQAPTPAKQGKSAQQTPKGSQGKKKAASDDDDEEDDEEEEDDEDMEEDDDEDDEDEDDEEDEDEDDEDDEDEEEQEAIKKKIASLKKDAQPKKDKKAQNELNTKSPEPKSKKGKTLPANQKSDDTKQGAKTNNPAQNKAFQMSMEVDQQRKRERDARTLFIRGLPTDITTEEIKALSPDILDVSLPKSLLLKRKSSSLFGFLEFANEKKAEENFIKLQKKKLRGQELYIDYSGEKSKNKRGGNPVNLQNVNKKKLFVSGLPVDATMAEIGQLFPRSCVVTINNAPEYRNCYVVFHTEEDTTEAFKANGNAKIRGRAINVMYAVEKPNVTKHRKGGFKRPFEGKQNFQSNKKMRMQK